VQLKYILHLAIIFLLIFVLAEAQTKKIIVTLFSMVPFRPFLTLSNIAHTCQLTLIRVLVDWFGLAKNMVNRIS